MPDSSTTALPARWNDPFRLVLVLSLLALGAWAVLHAGATSGHQTRLRTVDVDAAATPTIVVALDDVSPFDSPLEETDRPTIDAAPAASPARTPGARAGDGRASRQGTRAGGRSSGASGGSSPQPTTPRPPAGGGNDTNPGAPAPPSAGGGDGNGTGNGSSTSAPRPGADPVTPGGGVGSGGGAAGVDLPGVAVPQLPSRPGGAASSGTGGAPGGATPIAREVVALLEDGHRDLVDADLLAP